MSASATGALKIRRLLLSWYKRSARKLPWRETHDPYRIWVSEIMLQQTRVATVIPYYERFLERFPDVETLAKAPEQELLTVWSGLGYYSRARNMQKAAKQIAQDGGFPTDYERIRQLPGIGDYTAAAIASIAFNLPYPVLDGNVLRVLSRITSEAGDIGSSTTRRRLLTVAGQLLDRKQPGISNQALMELGACICLPKDPKCLLCPVSSHCEARRLGRQAELPVKLCRMNSTRVEKTLLLVEREGKILLWKRMQGPRLQGFWELPEADQLPRARHGKPVGEFRHSITNHNYRFTVMTAHVNRIPAGFSWISRDQLEEIPISTTTRKALVRARP